MTPDSPTPLSTAAQHILLALSSEDRHRYGLMQEVSRQSGGQYRLGPSTVYDNLEKLLDQGLVAESPRRSPKKDPRRRCYRITPQGRRVFAAEIQRLESIGRQAKAHLRTPKPREA